MVPQDSLRIIAECVALGVGAYPEKTVSRAQALGASEEDAASTIALCIERGLLRAEGTSLRVP